MRRLPLFLPLLLATNGAWATTINKIEYGKGGRAAPSATAQTGSLTPEQSLALKKVFVFPAVDEASGVLAPKLDEKLAQIFQNNRRFDLVRDPQVTRALNAEDPAYTKAATSREVHREAARTSGADTTALLRTKNVGNETEMTLEFRDANGEILFSESGSIPGYSSLETRWGLVDKLYRTILAKLPFEGTVGGRTANTITVDMGLGDIREGEEIEIARIVSMQRHPLLNVVVNTDYVRVGRAKITTVDKVMSFAEIQEEYTGERIFPGHKVLKAKPIVRRSEAEPAEPGPKRPGRGKERTVENDDTDPFEDRLQGEFDRKRARFGAAGVTIGYGSLSHAHSANNTNRDFSGTGLGATLDGELWVTKQWIFSLGYTMHSANLSGPDGQLGGASFKRLEAYGGYRLFASELGEGAIVTGKLGYQNLNYDLPTNAGLNVGAKKYTGPTVRVDVEVSLSPVSRANAGFGIMPFSSVEQDGVNLGTPKGGTVISLGAGWAYRLTDSLWARLAFSFDSASTDYDSGASGTDKRFAIGPGLQYTF